MKRFILLTLLIFLESTSNHYQNGYNSLLKEYEKTKKIVDHLKQYKGPMALNDKRDSLIKFNQIINSSNDLIEAITNQIVIEQKKDEEELQRRINIPSKITREIALNNYKELQKKTKIKIEEFTQLHEQLQKLNKQIEIDIKQLSENIEVEREETFKEYIERKEKEHETKYDEQVDAYNKIQSESKKAIQLMKMEKENESDFYKIAAAATEIELIGRKLMEIARCTKNDQLKEQSLQLHEKIIKNIKELEPIIDSKKQKYPSVKKIEDTKYDESIKRISILNNETKDFTHILSDFKSELDNCYMKEKHNNYFSRTQDSNLEETNDNKNKPTVNKKIIGGIILISGCMFIYYLGKKLFSKINDSDQNANISYNI